jgi:hypothetical protein
MLEGDHADIPFVILEVLFNEEMLILILYLQVYLTQLYLIVFIVLYILILL